MCFKGLTTTNLLNRGPQLLLTSLSVALKYLDKEGTVKRIWSDFASSRADMDQSCNVPEASCLFPIGFGLLGFRGFRLGQELASCVVFGCSLGGVWDLVR